jgi:hypothetical protein
LSAVPAIFSRIAQQPRLGVLGRLLAGLVAAAALGVLLVAAWLPPNPSGVGTHTSLRILRLQPCPFLARTGIPCVTCGFTTSFAWLARGNLVASAYVQPMGFVLAIMTAICFWASLYVMVTGKPVYRLLGLLPDRYYGVPLIGLAILAWGWKIFIHVHGIDGWH